MNVLLVSDNEAIGIEVRKVLLHQGLDCPASNVVVPGRVAQRLSQGQVDLIVFVMPPEPEAALLALDVLTRLPRGAGTHVMAVGPASDTKLVLRALRGAVDDYLDQDDLATELVAALDRRRQHMAVPEKEGRVIVVLSPSGGSGSSTLAANVATVLATQHKSVALMDLRLESGDLAALLDLKPIYTLSDLCQNTARMDRSLLERALVRHESGVHLLAPPRQISDIARITSDGVRQALALARTAFPYVIIDLEHSFRDEQAQVLRLADVIILVLRLDFVSLRNARRTLDYLEQLGINKDRVRVVINRYGQPKEIPHAKAEEALGVKIFHYVPDDPKTVNRANNNGVPVVLEAPSAKVSRSVASLAASVNGRHLSR